METLHYNIDIKNIMMLQIYNVDLYHLIKTSFNNQF